MPVNKNAMTRYQILDGLLSDRYHDYSMGDLLEELNHQLEDMNLEWIGRRTLEKDIAYIEREGPFMAEIERYFVLDFNKEKQKHVRKKCLRYANPRYSINKKEMTDDECYLLSEVFSLLGQFEELPNLKALDRMRRSFHTRQHKPVISFMKNPLENSTLWGELFTAAAHQQVIELHYHTFAEPETDRYLNMHPYLLKEYNRRWFLIGAAEQDGKMLNFALDRIDKVVPLPSHRFVEYDGDLNERFEDIVGVTLYDDRPVEHILFWVSDSSKDYVMTKPIHESQKHYTGNRDSALREQYPTLSDGAFFSIDCIKNYELIRELTSFGKDLIVLHSDGTVADDVRKRVREMNEQYEDVTK